MAAIIRSPTPKLAPTMMPTFTRSDTGDEFCEAIVVDDGVMVVLLLELMVAKQDVLVPART